MSNLEAEEAPQPITQAEGPPSNEAAASEEGPLSGECVACGNLDLLPAEGKCSNCLRKLANCERHQVPSRYRCKECQQGLCPACRQEAACPYCSAAWPVKARPKKSKSGPLTPPPPPPKAKARAWMNSWGAAAASTVLMLGVVAGAWWFSQDDGGPPSGRVFRASANETPPEKQWEWDLAMESIRLKRPISDSKEAIAFLKAQGAKPKAFVLLQAGDKPQKGELGLRWRPKDKQWSLIIAKPEVEASQP